MGAGKIRLSLIAVFQEAERQSAEEERTVDKASLSARSQRDAPWATLSPRAIKIHLAPHFINHTQ